MFRLCDSCSWGTTQGIALLLCSQHLVPTRSTIRTINQAKTVTSIDGQAGALAVAMCLATWRFRTPSVAPRPPFNKISVKSPQIILEQRHVESNKTCKLNFVVSPLTHQYLSFFYLHLPTIVFLMPFRGIAFLSFIFYFTCLYLRV